MAVNIQLRRDTAANWTLHNPVLADGEIGIETGSSPLKIKIGNGVDDWQTLTYVPVKGDAGPAGPSGTLEDNFETVSKNIKQYPSSLGYTSGDLTSVVYDLGGGDSITKTLNYTSGDLTSIVLSGDTPNGIDLTKTLTYTSGNLTGISYS